MEYRTEQDLLGELAVPAAALHGIDTERALANFPLARRGVHARLIHAYGTVKLACLLTNRSLGYLAGAAFDALEAACHDLREGRLDEHVRVDALQGGAGTSTNMNVNEVLANRALQILGRPLGDYATISPHDHVNRHQSTNDTYPTALKVAAIGGVRELEQGLVELVETLQAQEHALADVVKIGRTELQDAVLTTLGRTFSAYAEAFSRDRWRVYKCEERLRVVNLGGTAIGTGMGAPREYIFRVVDQLRDLTGIGLARAENLVDATQNVDVFVEVSGILKACAANLLKVATDLRLLSSGPDAGLGELTLPAKQPGSSIMPGKVNPVIPEAVAQAALQVIANDQAITLAAGSGNLELNQYLPLIAENLLTNIDLLTNAVGMLRRDCIVGLEANRERCRQHVDAATAVITSLIPALGYQQAQQVLAHARAHGTTLRAAAAALELLTAEEFDALTAPEAVTRLGFVPEAG